MRPRDIRDQIGALIRAYKPQHLVHVGAHRGEEMPGYHGIPKVTLVEPNPRLATALRIAYPHVTVVEAACSDHTGVADLHIPRRTNMATLAGGTGGQTIRVRLRRLVDIAPDADAAVIDAQGHELQVLAAAPWEVLRLVIVETCTVDDPAVAPLQEKVDQVMAEHGFREIARWARDYQAIKQWADGVLPKATGEVRDVAYARG